MAGGALRITLEYEQTSPQFEESRKRRDRLYAVLDQAASYERHLWETEAGAPVAYLEPRSARPSAAVSPGALARPRPGGESAAEGLHARGAPSRRADEHAGQRLLPAAADVPARRRARSDRRLPGAEAPGGRPLRGKYVNSPEGELFHKSAVLYGLNLARAAIAKQERAVVVEGNTDVIALHQAGFEPVVASMGTALTEDQVRNCSG